MLSFGVLSRRRQSELAQERFEQLQELTSSMESSSDKAGSVVAERDALQQEVETLKLSEHQLRMDLADLRDRLELAEEGSKRSQELERKLLKYERKLEEVQDVQQHVRSMEERNSELLDKVVTLEAENTELKRFQDQVRALRDKNAQLEHDNMDARSRLLDLETQLSTAKAELATEIEKRTFIEEQLGQTKEELAHAQEAGASSRSAGGLGLFESPAELKEKVARLEREVKVLREGGAAQGGADAQLLRDELEHERRLRNERDTQYLEATKKIADLQRERAQLTALAEEQAKTAASQSESSVRRAESNVDRLEKRCVELESRNQELEDEKAAIAAQKQKIEAFVKRAMTDMQEKVTWGKTGKRNYGKRVILSPCSDCGCLKQFKSVTTSQRQQLTKFRDRIHYLEDRLKDDAERHRQERAMLASVLYEYGLSNLNKTFHEK